MRGHFLGVFKGAVETVESFALLAGCLNRPVALLSEAFDSCWAIHKSINILIGNLEEIF